MVVNLSHADEEELPIIVHSPDASFMEQLAAREIQRYLYVRTGELLDIQEYMSGVLDDTSAFIVAQKKSVLADHISDHGDLREQVADLDNQSSLIKSFQRDGRDFLVIVGGDNTGTLYGAYRFAEHLGVRFFLHGDVIPDERIDLEFPEIDEQQSPLFPLRGIHPFHDFPEGPDWWNMEDYEAILSQLPKLRMNFFGLHTYPEGHPNAEPTVWIGLPHDMNDDGDVTFSYPSSYMNTQRGNWGYQPKLTSEFTHGAAQLFDRNVYGPDVMGHSMPRPDKLEDCNAVFNRTADMLNEAFEHAQRLGIKTCVGTETPLTVPSRLKDRLKQMGEDPEDLAVILDLYEGMFLRIMRSYPIDYYWLWTPEGWTWRDETEEQLNATKWDLLTAIAAIKNVDAPFTLATCGWVLGPKQDRALFDEFLMKEMPMSCINRQVGHAPVEPGFEAVEGRPKWAIPWLEDDPALISPQLWVGRMRADAFDALKYGCTGLMGIHWRTRILGPNVLALAWAAWDQQGWKEIAQQRKKEQEAVEGPIGGQHASTNEFIFDTYDQPLYRTVRFGMNQYRFDVPNGEYKVTLGFCETAYEEEGRRVFDVRIENEDCLEDFDILAAVGRNRAVEYSFSPVQVHDGWLEIDFLAQQDNPSIATISIESGELKKRVNCGGEAYKEYNADWPKSEERRDLPAQDFYEDWAIHLFGERAGEDIAEIFKEIDGVLPRPSNWVNGPGGIVPDDRPWDEVEEEYEFVEDLERLRSKVRGDGNRARFNYWLDNFRYMKANAHVNCLWAEYNARIKEIKDEEDEKARKRLAEREALPLREKLVETVSEVYEYLLPTVSTTGEMGTVANWEQHILPNLIEKTGKELAELLGEPLPEDAQLPMEYDGECRVIVPTVRTSVNENERLPLDIIVLSEENPESASVYWRYMGEEEFTEIPLTPISRGVYQVEFPHRASYRGFEYYVYVRADGERVYWPATAPDLCQTVVVAPRPE